jgi:hypothetical protein
MNAIITLLAFLAAALLSACATQPTASSAANRIPANRIFDASLATPLRGRLKFDLSETWG